MLALGDPWPGEIGFRKSRPLELSFSQEYTIIERAPRRRVFAPMKRGQGDAMDLKGQPP